MEEFEGIPHERTDWGPFTFEQDKGRGMAVFYWVVSVTHNDSLLSIFEIIHIQLLKLENLLR